MKVAERISMQHDLKYIARTYNVPAKKDRRILYQGKKGTVIGARGAYLLIMLDGEKQAMLYHPTWKIEYLEGNSE